MIINIKKKKFIMKVKFADGLNEISLVITWERCQK